MRDSAKPHIKARTIIIMAQDIATPNASVPDWARKASKHAVADNLSSSDFSPPRLKLLAGQSPEVMQGVPGAVPGNFWLTILNQNLGKTVRGTPIYRHVSYNIWSPNREQKAPLATASDGIHWDVPNQTFEVRFPNGSQTYTWATKRTVEESGLAEFGSSQPENPRSRPAASLTYDFLWMIDTPDGRKVLCAWTSSVSGIKATKNFNSAVDAQGIDMCLQRYEIVMERSTGPTGDTYFTYNYHYIGTIDEGDVDRFQALAERYSKVKFASEQSSSDDGPRAKPAQVHQETVDVDDIPF
jgi:hypothetical protein